MLRVLQLPTHGMRQPLTSLPASGASEDAWAAIHGNTSKTVKLLPFSNLPYVQPILNGFTSDE